MIRGMLYSSAAGDNLTGGLELVDKWVNGNEGWLWLDIRGDDEQQVRNLLRSQFDINDLAISDALRQRHPPKIEDFEDHVFLLARGLDVNSTDLNYKTIQISFFIGDNYLVTFHRKESRSINLTWETAQKAEFDYAASPLYVTCRVLRAVVDRYTPILLNLEQRLEQMEDEMFVSRDDKLLEEMVETNSNLKKMRRTLTYHATLLKEFKQLDRVSKEKHIRHLAHDVFEHFDRLNSLSNLYQELVVDLMNGYMSLSAHRLNQIMKVLTIFTVIFLPLTLMVGIYGMNFDYIPELRWRYGYFTLLGTMATVVIVAFALLKWKKWW